MNINVEIKESDKNRRISIVEAHESSLENIEKTGYLAVFHLMSSSERRLNSKIF